MNPKINKMLGIFIWLLVIGLLVYSRFINLGWGLPYPMHPDERNMANAIQSMNCEISNFRECFNPHFFAYGQFSLYLAYLLVLLLKLSPTMALRTISAGASVLTVYVLYKIISNFIPPKAGSNQFLILLILIFSPYAIQFAHFGTTESLLMFFYSLIIYLTLLLSEGKITILSYVFKTSLIMGLSLGTKVSSILFMIIPLMVLIFKRNNKFPIYYFLFSKFFDLLIFFIFTFLFFVMISPHNLFSFKEFMGALNYESDVALGKYVVFYTRQFVETVPVLFQATKVFPYAMGLPMSLMGLIGFIGIGWKDRKVNIIRLAFLAYFLPSAFIFAKWVRFMAPVFPVLTIFAALLLIRIKIINIIKIVTVILLVLPGINYLSVYQNPDVRFQASDWINKNIPNNSYVLSETANVVDIPLELESYKVHKVYKVISFNFYDLDENSQLQEELREHLEKADYIFIPSRRVFANHPKDKYPLLNKYYEDLFSGKLGFKKIAEFSAGLNDEQAEETWTVFDHPVIRIYKKVKTS